MKIPNPQKVIPIEIKSLSLDLSIISSSNMFYIILNSKRLLLVPSNGTAIRKVLLYTAISTSYLVVIV
jgi:hypothetical protein